MFFPCGRSHKKLLEEEGQIDFLKKDMKKRQLCRPKTFSSGKDLFVHAMHEKNYGSIVHLGLMYNLS